MSRIFLDTSAYSAFQVGHRDIVFRLKEVPEILVSPIVLGELRSGFLKGLRVQRNRELLEQFLETPRVRVVPIDDAVANRYALIFAHLRTAGTPIPTNDVWIAAGAMSTGASLLTLDRHFSKVHQIVAEIHDPEVT